MRYLLLDHYYPEFTASWYADNPGLAAAGYDDQRQSFARSLFGETQFEVAALRGLGHVANDVIVNVWPAQAKWAQERGVEVPARRTRRGMRLRRRVVPWPTSRADRRW